MGKYEFNSKQEALDLIEDYNITNEGHKSTFIKLGYLCVVEPTFDDEGLIVTPGEYSDKYSVDVLWYKEKEHPEGWADYAINIEGEGKHSFYGIKYKNIKLKKDKKNKK